MRNIPGWIVFFIQFFRIQKSSSKAGLYLLQLRISLIIMPLSLFFAVICVRKIEISSFAGKKNRNLKRTKGISSFCSLCNRK